MDVLWWTHRRLLRDGKSGAASRYRGARLPVVGGKHQYPRAWAIKARPSRSSPRSSGRRRTPSRTTATTSIPIPGVADMAAGKWNCLPGLPRSLRSSSGTGTASCMSLCCSTCRRPGSRDAFASPPFATDSQSTGRLERPEQGVVLQFAVQGEGPAASRAFVASSEEVIRQIGSTGGILGSCPACKIRILDDEFRRFE